MPRLADAPCRPRRGGAPAGLRGRRDRRGGGGGHLPRFLERRLESTAQALASAVDTEIAGSLLALSTLATARNLDDPADLPDFHVRARRAAAILGTRIFLIAPDATIILHTQEPFGTPPRPLQPAVAALARPVFTTGRPAVGDLILGYTKRGIAGPGLRAGVQGRDDGFLQY